MARSTRAGMTIKFLRTYKHMTQRELAEALGLTPETISQWEVGNTEPRCSHFEAAMRYFGYRVELVPIDAKGGKRHV